MSELRAAGCVFAEEEAAILLVAATSAPATLDGMLARRVAGEPLEQIVGWVEFAGHRLTVVPGVFVPRQRTTLLAEHTTRVLRMAEDAAVLVEAFCGIGPVASTVARVLPGTTIHLGDRDQRALDCARANVGTGAGIHLLDCLSGLPSELAGRVAVICAVPPYVPESAREFLPREATDHESPNALFGGADGLDLVRRLIAESLDWLRPDGTVLIEVGHGQTETAAAYARELGYTTHSHLGEDEQTAVLELRR
ncbi:MULTISPECIES: putative protein N(5)-glutamine methyltransferase [unclassified Brevibacterium]|uniref:N5-glutamine methyltransferase family protein n=1 Tax=unclassified Brevibacterium TaxID=2614124 RepID=UPI001E3A2A04|nr:MULTISPECIES: putative protein N(5)-glutamine methyltransferase [unclassified Brevibacterium]MCD1285923.1 hypothetical protein [Brevibacterium sp. CCUG 69071]MDK8434988.1 putative protein N(5)-glutamine methyltransferase [Brevibacterium sp. H-BE7]